MVQPIDPVPQEQQRNDDDPFWMLPMETNIEGAARRDAYSIVVPRKSKKLSGSRHCMEWEYLQVLTDPQLDPS